MAIGRYYSEVYYKCAPGFVPVWVGVKTAAFCFCRSGVFPSRTAIMRGKALEREDMLIQEKQFAFTMK